MQTIELEKNIVLIGFMGVGKTTIYEELLGMGLTGVDTDSLIEEMAQMSVSDIFAQYGEEHFRDLETQAVRKASEMAGGVISCGGGAVLRPENVECLQRTGKVVLLTATPETLLERLREDDTRPKLRGHKTVEGITQLMEERRAVYEKAAQITIATDGKTPAQICQEILAAMEPSKAHY